MADLFAAAATEHLARQAPLAARLRPATLDEIVGQEHLLGRRAAAAGADRGRPAVVGHPLGTAGHGQDDAGPAHRPHHREGVRPAVGGERDGEGRPRGRRRRPATGSASTGRARSCSSTRSTGSTRPSRTRCCRRSRPACSCSSAPPPRTRTSRSTRRCSRARRCSGSSRSTPDGRGHAARARARPPRGPTADAGRRRPTWSSGPAGDGRHALTSLEVAVALAARSAGDAARGDARRRRGGARHQGAALRARRPLRRDQRLHQEHPGLRSRRRPLLAGPHARVGRGRPLHRPPPGHPGLRGHRRGRLDEPARGRRRRPGGRVRRACPRPSSTWPTPSSTWPPRPSRTG